MRVKVVVAVVLVLIVAALIDSAVVVPEDKFAIMLRFDKPYSVIYKPGLYFKPPLPVGSVIFVDKRLKLSDLRPVELLTNDKKNLVMYPYAVWRVRNPLKFISSVRNETAAALRLSSLIISELGVQTAHLPLSAFISTKPEEVKLEELLKKVAETCRKDALSNFGVEIVSVGLRRLTFPEQNLRHVFNRMRSERERIAKKYRAEGEERAMQIQAETEKEVRKIIAEAKQKAAKIRADADAKALQILSAAHAKNPQLYRFLLSLETLEKLLEKNSTLVLSTDSPLLKPIEQEASK